MVSRRRRQPVEMIVRPHKSRMSDFFMSKQYTNAACFWNGYLKKPSEYSNLKHVVPDHSLLKSSFAALFG